MIEQYKILYRGGSGELVEKKSRFIATTSPVTTEQAAAEFIAGIRKQYWDARHHCFAYVIGAGAQLCRCGDDGEPSQTAGRPMLDVLLGQELRDVCVVVTRYFGGTLLGTGGLVRAYSGAAQAGLRESQIIEKKLARKLKIITDYNGIGKVQYLLAGREIAVLDTQYTDQVEIVALIPGRELAAVMAEITEGTSARAAMEPLETLYYGIADKEIILFED